jgi:hypothetical protein
MKLHHFVTKEAKAEVSRIQEIGKALAPVRTAVPQARVAEAVKKPVIKKDDTEIVADGDITQAMRDYAVKQAEGSLHGHSHVAHRKMRHYD